RKGTVRMASSELASWDRDPGLWAGLDVRIIGARAWAVVPIAGRNRLIGWGRPIVIARSPGEPRRDYDEAPRAPEKVCVPWMTDDPMARMAGEHGMARVATAARTAVDAAMPR